MKLATWTVFTFSVPVPRINLKLYLPLFPCLFLLSVFWTYWVTIRDVTTSLELGVFWHCWVLVHEDCGWYCNLTRKLHNRKLISSSAHSSDFTRTLSDPASGTTSSLYLFLKDLWLTVQLFKARNSLKKTHFQLFQWVGRESRFHTKIMIWKTH